MQWHYSLLFMRCVFMGHDEAIDNHDTVAGARVGVGEDAISRRKFGLAENVRQRKSEPCATVVGLCVGGHVRWAAFVS